MILLFAAAAAAPLAPLGKWNLDYQPTSCVLARQYGDARRPVTLGWRAIPLTDTVELVIAERRSDAAFTNGTAEVDFGGQTGEGRFFSFPTNVSTDHLTRITIERALFAGVAEPVDLAIRLQGGRTFRFRVEGSGRAFALLETCVDRTLVAWGLDPAAVAAAMTPAVGAKDEKAWLSWTDYPPAELARGQQGISVLMWKVGIDGRVSDCRAVVPSGSALLDKTGCDAITQRGRYTPAQDVAGRPVASWKTRRIIWSTPGGLLGDY